MSSQTWRTNDHTRGRSSDSPPRDFTSLLAPIRNNGTSKKERSRHGLQPNWGGPHKRLTAAGPSRNFTGVPCSREWSKPTLATTSIRKHIRGTETVKQNKSPQLSDPIRLLVLLATLPRVELRPHRPETRQRFSCGFSLCGHVVDSCQRPPQILGSHPAHARFSIRRCTSV